ncbi:unnamed protein product [Amoebophrya sp. A120]|nr:unnamed protein product [Amoebophrya sp. A120]|eukprot:GSA120T00005172001.1
MVTTIRFLDLTGDVGHSLTLLQDPTNFARSTCSEEKASSVDETSTNLVTVSFLKDELQRVYGVPKSLLAITAIPITRQPVIELLDESSSPGSDFENADPCHMDAGSAEEEDENETELRDTDAVRLEGTAQEQLQKENHTGVDYAGDRNCGLELLIVFNHTDENIRVKNDAGHEMKSTDSETTLVRPADFVHPAPQSDSALACTPVDEEQKATLSSTIINQSEDERGTTSVGMKQDELGLALLRDHADEIPGPFTTLLNSSLALTSDTDPTDASNLFATTFPSRTASPSSSPCGAARRAVSRGSVTSTATPSSRDSSTGSSTRSTSCVEEGTVLCEPSVSGSGEGARENLSTGINPARSRKASKQRWCYLRLVIRSTNFKDRISLLEVDRMGYACCQEYVFQNAEMFETSPNLLFRLACTTSTGATIANNRQQQNGVWQPEQFSGRYLENLTAALIDYRARLRGRTAKAPTEESRDKTQDLRPVAEAQDDLFAYVESTSGLSAFMLVCQKFSASKDGLKMCFQLLDQLPAHVVTHISKRGITALLCSRSETLSLAILDHAGGLVVDDEDGCSDDASSLVSMICSEDVLYRTNVMHLACSRRHRDLVNRILDVLEQYLWSFVAQETRQKIHETMQVTAAPKASPGSSRKYARRSSSCGQIMFTPPGVVSTGGKIVHNAKPTTTAMNLVPSMHELGNSRRTSNTEREEQLQKSPKNGVDSNSQTTHLDMEDTVSQSQHALMSPPGSTTSSALILSANSPASCRTINRRSLSLESGSDTITYSGKRVPYPPPSSPLNAFQQKSQTASTWILGDIYKFLCMKDRQDRTPGSLAGLNGWRDVEQRIVGLLRRTQILDRTGSL